MLIGTFNSFVIWMYQKFKVMRYITFTLGKRNMEYIGSKMYKADQYLMINVMLYINIILKIIYGQPINSHSLKGQKT